MLGLHGVIPELNLFASLDRVERLPRGVNKEKRAVNKRFVYIPKSFISVHG